MSNTPDTVSAITSLNITGNVIPHRWWSEIKFENGKPDCIGVVILSEIVYWYRASEVRDEQTGQLKGWRKRFKADKLQRSTQSLADAFGFTKRQVIDALKRLTDAGLITREFRNINTQRGVMTNVQYIEPVAEKIKSITVGEVVSCDEPQDPVRYNAQPRAVERGTYTETTTEITNKDLEKRRDAHEEATPEQLENLFSPQSPEPQSKFRIPLNWRPDREKLEPYCMNAGCPTTSRPDQLIDGIIGEWVNIWHSDGGANSEAKWLSLLAGFIKRKLADHDSGGWNKQTKPRSYGVPQRNQDFESIDHREGGAELGLEVI